MLNPEKKHKKKPWKLKGALFVISEFLKMKTDDSIPKVLKINLVRGSTSYLHVCPQVQKNPILCENLILRLEYYLYFL